MSHIKLRDVSLDFILPASNPSFKQAMVNFLKGDMFRKKLLSTQTANYRALHNLNFDIEHGDRIALIGQNGAGKSTLLRLLGDIYTPSQGYIERQGTVSSLLDINIGINFESTGYENIILLGILRGKTRKEMEAKLNDIENFTQLGSFLKMPVRTYSSGMILRLSFAVLTAIETDILLLDEVIGVGDQGFMERAYQRLSQLIDNSHILVLSSHSSDIIRRFCNKALVLKNGHAKYLGDVEAGLRFYTESFSEKDKAADTQTCFA